MGKRIEWNVRKFSKILFLTGVSGLFLVILPTARSGTHFEMDPVKVAAAETRMWQAYYTNNYSALKEELNALLCSQFGLSVSDAQEIGEPLARAAMKFESAENNYSQIVLPDLEYAYSLIKQKLDVRFDSKEAAMAELAWWVARRIPGKDSIENVGSLIANLYSVVYGKNLPAFEHAGLLRAEAAHTRDIGGKMCDWNKVESLLRNSYQELQNGLKLSLNTQSVQVALRWQPNKEKNIAGYKVYYGESSRNYSSHVNVANQTSCTVTGLENGKRYYFAVTAYNSNGLESGFSAEVSHKATVSPISLSLSQNSAEQNTLPKIGKGEMLHINDPYRKPAVVWLPQKIDLTRYTKGSFPVKVRVEEIEAQQYQSIFPRIKYSIGTGSCYGYFDMIHEDGNVWRYDIRDPNWNRYRSNSLHYQIKVFDKNGTAIAETRWKSELIDSFLRVNHKDDG